jgi:hypothetical protein
MQSEIGCQLFCGGQGGKGAREGAGETKQDRVGLGCMEGVSDVDAWRDSSHKNDAAGHPDGH